MTLVLAAALAGCGSGDADGINRYGLVAVIDPANRAVRVETEGCGFASGRTGSGVAIGDGLVITVAHLIVEAESVTVQIDGQKHEGVSVAAVDRSLDLAVIRIPSVTIPEITMTSVPKGARGSIVRGAASGTVAFEVRGVVELTIEEVFGTTRHARNGYELDAQTSDGDSGAGAYDELDRLIGIVFATSQDGAATWVTASSEIEEFVSGIGPTDSYRLCE